MIRSLVIGFFGAILSIGVATYFHLKAYEEPNVYYDTRPSLVLVYVELRGDYVQTSHKIAEVEQLIMSKGLKCESTFGLFFDDPDLVATQDLKSWVGCAYYSTNQPPPDIENLKLFKMNEESNVLTADFAGSPALGPRKVYPKAQKMLGKTSLFPAIEIYTYDNNKELKTKYYFLLEQSTSESL